MPLELGGAFRPRQVEQAVFDPEPRQPTVEDLRSEQLLVALAALQEALQNMPAPVVNVSEPDLSAIVQAVTQLKGSATADEIARAVVAEISPGGEVGMDRVLEELTEALKKLDFRLQGLNASAGMMGGGGGPSTVSLSEATIKSLTAPQKTDDDETQSLLTAIRAEQYRRTDPLPGGANLIGATVGYEEFYSSAVGGRVAYNSSTGLVNAPALATTTVAVLSNPAGSGVDMEISKLSISQSGAGTWERLRNPTFTVTGAAQPNVNRGGGSSTGQGKLYLAGAVSITAFGTSSKHHHGQANSESIDRVALGIILRPGQAAVWRYTNPSATTATTVAIEPVWVEKAAAA